MKLLFDENLSRRLVKDLADLYPGSEHVVRLGWERSDDGAIWALAKPKGYTIVTQDSDFAERSILEGAPPKVIWIRIGNSRTSDRGPAARKLSGHPKVHRRPGRHLLDVETSTRR